MREAKKKASAEKAQLEKDYNSLNHKVSYVFQVMVLHKNSNAMYSMGKRGGPYMSV